ncbi:MAG TPA: phosphoglucosamine mutase [Mycobacteriales bacterium]|nr:phosphoglucosamine mutase [Mycobacteriales bacterium]
MARLFGTDGVRGLANGDVLTPELALRLAAAAARHLLGEQLGAGTRPVVVIGRDTRPSGQMLEAAAFAGFAAVGCDVVRLGVVPTPAVAYEVQRRAALGLMVSASHNPVADNGLKLFAAGGTKLEDRDEDAIEALLEQPLSGRSGVDLGADVTEGYLSARRDYADDPTYVEHLLSTVGRLDGLHVVVDGAQGAASVLAPEVYRAAGARVTELHCEGNGWLINDGCGATHPESLAAAVVEHGADLGIAHDGDADRCVVVDAGGTVLNGDQVLGLLALARKEAGLPGSDVLVATVMSNLGLHQAMQAAGIRVVATAVGDRYVLEEMRAHGYPLGGEQSGHVVLADHATTGDGLLTALHVMDRVARSGRPVAELASVVQLLPQVLVNVTADRGRATAPDVGEAVAKEEAALGGSGRVLLRPSGTEPLVRVMVEAPTEEQAQAVAQRLATVVAERGEQAQNP